MEEKNYVIKFNISYLPLVPILATSGMLSLFVYVIPHYQIFIFYFKITWLTIQIIFWIKVLMMQKKYRKKTDGKKRKRKKLYTALLWVNGFATFELLSLFGDNPTVLAESLSMAVLFIFFGNLIILFATMSSDAIREDYSSYKTKGKNADGKIKGYLKNRFIVIGLGAIFLFLIVLLLNLNATDVIAVGITLLLTLNFYNDKLDIREEDKKLVELKKKWNTIKVAIVSFSASYLIFERLRDVFQNGKINIGWIKNIYEKFFLLGNNPLDYLDNSLGFLMLFSLIFMSSALLMIIVYERPVMNYRKVKETLNQKNLDLGEN